MSRFPRLARCAAVALVAALLGFVHGNAAAQAFPAKTVTIVVPFPPAGGADTLARTLAPKLSALWGQTVIVENRPGASGHIGTEQVANAPADGYTLVMASTAAITEKNIARLAPVALVSAEAYVVALNAAVPIANVRELIAYAKANPGKLRFGSSGIGAASHLSGELFKAQAKVDMQHVPYKGTGQALTDLLGGQIELMFAPTQTVIPQLQSGRLKAIAVTGTQPLEALPQPADRGRIGPARLPGAGLVRPARAEGDAGGDDRQAARRRQQGARAARGAQRPDRQGRRAGQCLGGRVRPLHRQRAGQVVEADQGCGHRHGVAGEARIQRRSAPAPILSAPSSTTLAPSGAASTRSSWPCTVAPTSICSWR